MLVVEQDVVGNVVGLEDLVVLMDGVVDDGAHAVHLQELVQTLGNLVQLLVDAGCEGVMYLALVADDARLHADEVVLRSLAPVGILALAQEFLGLQVVVGIILIAQRDGRDVQLLEALDEGLVTIAVGQHLDQALLGAVVAVLATALALGNPQRGTLLLYGKMHISRQLHGSGQRLDAAQVALHDKALVQTHQLGDPVINEQVVANGDFARVAAAFQQQVAQLGRVEHDVAMVGDKGVGNLLVQIFLAAGGQRCARLGHQTLDEGFHHLDLELVLGVDAEQHVFEFRILVVRQCHCHNLLETGLLYQDGHCGLEILVGNRADVLIFHWNGYVLVLYHSGLSG